MAPQVARGWRPGGRKVIVCRLRPATSASPRRCGVAALGLARARGHNKAELARARAGQFNGLEVGAGKRKSLALMTNRRRPAPNLGKLIAFKRSPGPAKKGPHCAIAPERRVSSIKRASGRARREPPVWAGGACDPSLFAGCALKDGGRGRARLSRRRNKWPAAGTHRGAVPVSRRRRARVGEASGIIFASHFAPHSHQRRRRRRHRGALSS